MAPPSPAPATDGALAVERMTRLQAVTAALARALPRGAIGDLFVREVRPAYGADAGWLAVVDDAGSALHPLAGTWHPAAEGRLLARVPLDAPVPAADVARDARARRYRSNAVLAEEYPHHAATLRALAIEAVAVLPLLVVGTGEPLFVSSLDECARRFPPVPAALVAQGYESFATLPLQANRRVFGIVAFNFRERRAFPPEERALLLAFAGQCAPALERARLYETERAARGGRVTAAGGWSPRRRQHAHPLLRSAPGGARTGSARVGPETLNTNDMPARPGPVPLVPRRCRRGRRAVY